MKEIVKDSFVVLSDFHSRREPLDKIKKYYLNEYDKVYILGDATERGEKGSGEGGIELLFEIKDLCEKSNGRVQYIPGNHDQLVTYYIYDILCEDREEVKEVIDDDRYMLIRNGGSKTVEDLDYLKRTARSRLIDIGVWLQEQPLQCVHTYKGQKYALAHAFFDMNEYRKNSNLNLLDLSSNSNLNHIVWFRKGQNNNKSLVNAVPSGDYIEVIGHTPHGGKQDLDLINSKGERVKVVCVDGGFTFGGEILKYDGGIDTFKTRVDYHKDTSPSEPQRPFDSRWGPSDPKGKSSQLSRIIDGFIDAKRQKPVDLNGGNQAYKYGYEYAEKSERYLQAERFSIGKNTHLTEFIEGFIARELGQPLDTKNSSEGYKDGYKYFEAQRDKGYSDNFSTCDGEERSINIALAEFIEGFAINEGNQTKCFMETSDAYLDGVGYCDRYRNCDRYRSNQYSNPSANTPITGFAEGYIANKLHLNGKFGSKQLRNDSQSFIDGINYYMQQLDDDKQDDYRETAQEDLGAQKYKKMTIIFNS